MNIIKKKFRTIFPVNEKLEDDIQGTEYFSKSNIYIYIYNEKIISKYSTDYDKNSNNLFGSFSLDQRKVQRENLEKVIIENNDPITVGSYFLNNNQIFASWLFCIDEENIEIKFIGEILLEAGDAIRGTFYKNGVLNIAERVYYNIDKPLPDTLIKEEING